MKNSHINKIPFAPLFKEYTVVVELYFGTK